MKILHFSDIHVCKDVWSAPKLEFIGKRTIGAANILLGRGVSFKRAEEKIGLLAELYESQDIDAVICTGDYTALGTAGELREARKVIEPFVTAPLGFVTLPGNHDIYQFDGYRDGRFELSFGDVLSSDLPDYQTSSGYPRARFLGENVVVLTVNSARPSVLPWQSNGRIPDQELVALDRLLGREDIQSRFVIIATHYAPRKASGVPDSPRHGLDNANALLRICCRVKRGMVIHGHIHKGFRVQVPESPIPMFCAGSATHEGRESFWVYDIDESRATATRGYFDGTRYRLRQHPINV